MGKLLLLKKEAATQTDAPKDNGAEQERELLFLTVEKLFTHPKNLRRRFPEEDVRQMAESIRSKGGVYQALLVVPRKDGQPGQYYVVDGNMRLAGARLLGTNCPKLKCEPMTENEAEQMLAMMVTGTIRYTPDPVSQALHYRRLMEEEGYTVRQIADATGIHTATIQNRLRLLLLDDEIQELVAKKELHADPRVVEALLSVENSTARVKIAKKLAAHRASIKAIVGSCQRLVKSLQEQKAAHNEGTPALNLASTRADRKIHPAAKVPWKKVRIAARNMCNACDMRLTLLKDHPEPAWSIIAHAAQETCNNCSVREVRQACEQCPAVTILLHLAKSAKP